MGTYQDGQIVTVDLGAVHRYPEIQCRVSTDEETVKRYREALLVDPAKHLKPVDAVWDGQELIQWDGEHRWLAYRGAERPQIPVRITLGDRTRAEELALGANDDHGLPRSHADKRKAVEKALAHPVFGQRTPGAIAKLCRVSRALVDSVKPQLVEKPVDGPRKGADGKTRDTSRVVEANKRRAAERRLASAPHAVAPAATTAQAEPADHPPARPTEPAPEQMPAPTPVVSPVPVPVQQTALVSPAPQPPVQEEPHVEAETEDASALLAKLDALRAAYLAQAQMWPFHADQIARHAEQTAGEIRKKYRR